MPLRLFRSGSARVRPCPACERKIQADATFCPSCYMVFRPEGAVALREYLQGARIPADIYMLRKLQTEDPDAGPVTRATSVPIEARSTPAAEVPPPASVDAIAPDVPDATTVSAQVDVAEPPKERGSEVSPPPHVGEKDRPRSRSRNGVEGFLAFAEPFPPPARSPEDISALYAWMLAKDPVIPNNLARLQEIHSVVFRDKPPARLGYEQHVLLLVEEDLGAYVTGDALGFHLAQLAAAYRLAADTYRKAESQGPPAVDRALWQMASLASRMRLEAWVYHTWHGQSPQLPSARQRELPLKFPGK